MCRDWRVRYLDAQGKVTHEYVTNAPTAFFARWNARDHWGLMAQYNAHKVICWPMPKAKPPSLNVY